MEIEGLPPDMTVPLDFNSLNSLWVIIIINFKAIWEIVQNKVNEKKGDSEVYGQELLKLQQEAFSEVFGPEDPGRVRDYEFGVTPTQVYGSRRASAAATSEVEEL